MSYRSSSTPITVMRALGQKSCSSSKWIWRIAQCRLIFPWLVQCLSFKFACCYYAQLLSRQVGTNIDDCSHTIICEVTSSYTTIRLTFLQAHTQCTRGDYVTACISQYSLSCEIIIRVWCPTKRRSCPTTLMNTLYIRPATLAPIHP